jgi:acetyl-CoA C-acetyltransferase/acetyl-CoA acyltransferase
VLVPTPEAIRAHWGLSRKLALGIGGRAAREILRFAYTPNFLTFTTGRSSEPVAFLYTPHDLDLLGEGGARMMDVFGLAGPDVRIVNAFPFAPHLAFWMTSFAGFRTGMLIVPTGGGKVVGSSGNLRLLEKLAATVLIATPGFAYHLARIARDERRDLSKIDTVILGAEKVTPGLKHKMAEALSACGAREPKILGTYGFTEARLAFAECPTGYDVSSGYHLYPDLCVIEVIDPVTLEPVGEGQDGEVVYSTISGHGSCVLRYRTGDLAVGGVTRAPCPYLRADRAATVERPAPRVGSPRALPDEDPRHSRRPDQRRSRALGGSRDRGMASRAHQEGQRSSRARRVRGTHGAAAGSRRERIRERHQEAPPRRRRDRAESRELPLSPRDRRPARHGDGDEREALPGPATEELNMYAVRPDTSIVLAAGLRTPFARAGGAYARENAAHLGAHVSRELLARTGIDPAEIDEVIVGCVGPPQDQANVGRVLALRAGVPRGVPARTVARNCASGMEAVTSAATEIEAGHGDLYLCVGVELMSAYPLVYGREMTDLFGRLSRAKSLPARVGAMLSFRPRFLAPRIALTEGLTDPTCGLIMGKTAEILAREFSIGREDADRYALESHQRARAARDAGRLAVEILPHLPLEARRPEDLVVHDDGIRDGQSLEALAKLKPYFEKPDGSRSAPCGINDGACALIVRPRSAHARSDCSRSRASRAPWAGLDPARMGLGPDASSPGADEASSRSPRWT